MLSLNRRSRGVDLGPYPLERLRRDPSVAKEEENRPPQTPASMPVGQNTYLIAAATSHLDAYNELREPEPFAKIAPVPEELSRRTSDIKGAGYFLDASQMGI